MITMFTASRTVGNATHTCFGDTQAAAEESLKDAMQRDMLIEAAEPRKVRIRAVTDYRPTSYESGRSVAVEPTCKYCHGAHEISSCPALKRKNEMKCFRCGGPHLARNCDQAA